MPLCSEAHQERTGQLRKAARRLRHLLAHARISRKIVVESEMIDAALSALQADLTRLLRLLEEPRDRVLRPCTEQAIVDGGEQP